jgi:predicted permease
MDNFLLIFICLISGFLIRRFIDLPKDAHKSINMWILYIALPAVSFKYIPYINWNKELILPILTPIITWIGAYIFISIYSLKKNINIIDKATLILTCGLSNTSFLVSLLFLHILVKII